ncbi:hypothetical protein LL266_16700 [Vibrio anguillarum]|uniref:hypothetical protein n=1 Tax=Vibrio anguillarum TaxID=55601 RepID=UPI001D187BB7|nr:hypothetical protein [Vibrio anguillarum]MCC4238130.1 hypothetical protein [Vibrio anguillarum]
MCEIDMFELRDLVLVACVFASFAGNIFAAFMFKNAREGQVEKLNKRITTTNTALAGISVCLFALLDKKTKANNKT